MAGKCTPLETYLSALPASQKEVTFSFEQVERIINAKLPSSAYEYQQWRENEKEGNHVNARVGKCRLEAERVDFNRKQARLVRLGTSISRQSEMGMSPKR